MSSTLGTEGALLAGENLQERKPWEKVRLRETEFEGGRGQSKGDRPGKKRVTFQPNSAHRKAPCNDRQAQKSTVAETGLFTDTCPNTGRAGETAPAEKQADTHKKQTQQRNTQAQISQIHSFPTNSSWKPPNPPISRGMS